MTPWSQVYDPFGNRLLSTAVAAIPIVLLLGSLAWLRWRAHWAALLALAAALAIAVLALGMPVPAALASAAFGAAYGLFPIGWIILNVLFLYTITNELGLFDTLQRGITRLTRDRRLQLVLVAFSFGAFFEGAAGFGTPVAVTGALLIGLGFSPLQASALSLIANTAPVAYGALGTPVVALQGVTGLDLHALSAMIGRQLPIFSIVIPFWLVWAYAGFRGMAEVWPALAVAGVAFAVPQFLVSNFHGPWLVDVVGAIVSLGAVTLFLRFWQPPGDWTPWDVGAPLPAPENPAPVTPRGSSAIVSRRELWRAGFPWIVLSIVVFAWGLPVVKDALNKISAPRLEVPALHQLVQRVPPVVAAAQPEPAVLTLNWLSATGTGILVAALIVGLALGWSPRELARWYVRTLLLVRYSLATIAAMMAIGFVTRYAGLDAILGLAFARTGVLYPLFGTLLGWLGVALTGSDTSSNVLFGSLQKITAQQLGISPTLMAAANSSGGVMGKMIDAQSIVVAGTATRWHGHEWEILRYVFFHSLALATLMGLVVMLQAYVMPFSRLVP
jgi:lactate permease